MTQTITDRVIAVEQEHQEEVDLRLSNWTPSRAYTMLVDAADDAGLDLTSYKDGDVVGIARVEYETDTGDEYGRTTDVTTVEFIESGDEFYADVEVTFEGQLRLPVISGAEEMEPTPDMWKEEVKEIISEGVTWTYLDKHDPDVTIKNVFRD